MEALTFEKPRCLFPRHPSVYVFSGGGVLRAAGTPLTALNQCRLVNQACQRLYESESTRALLGAAAGHVCAA